MLFIDLDGFKAINDAHGHSCGDVVLEEVTQRLKDALHTSGTLERMHGDEFVVLLPEVRGRDEIGILTTSLLTEVTRPVDIGDATASVTASIGVSLFPNDARNAPGLMHAAGAVEPSAVPPESSANEDLDGMRGALTPPCAIWRLPLAIRVIDRKVFPSN